MPTPNKVASTDKRSQIGTGMNQIMIPLPIIMLQANHLALRDTAPCSRHCRMGGPHVAWFSMQVSSAGQPRPAAQADNNKNGTVGMTGKTAPTMAKINPATANKRHKSCLLR